MAKLLPNLKHYHRPHTIEGAKELLRQGKRTTMIIGGGVSLGMIPRRQITDVIATEKLNLDYFIAGEELIQLGAGISLGSAARQLEPHDDGAARLIMEAISRSATTPLRNLMTIGGVLAGVGPWSDLPVALLALHTTLVIDGDQKIELERFLLEGPAKVLSRFGLVTEVQVQRMGEISGSFMKFGRNVTDLAIASAAVSRHYSPGCDPEIRVAVGGLVARPKRLSDVEEFFLSGCHGEVDRSSLLDLVSKTVTPRPDPRAEKEYRLNLVTQLIADCWEDLLEEGQR